MRTPTTEELKPKPANLAQLVQPAPHANDQEMQQRLGIMRLWRVEGMSRQEVKQQAMAFWNVCARTAQIYVKKVEAALTAHANSGAELVNLQLSQLMRDRCLKELSQRLVGASGMPLKELVQLVNATRTLLDSRDRTARAMHSLRAEKSEGAAESPSKADTGEMDTDLSGAAVPTDGIPVPPETQANETDADSLRTQAAGLTASPAPKGMMREFGAKSASEPVPAPVYQANPVAGNTGETLRAPDERPETPPTEGAARVVEPDSAALASLPPADQADFLRAMHCMEEAERIMRGRVPRGIGNRPDEDPLERLLRDATAAGTLPPVVPPDGKSRPDRGMRKAPAPEPDWQV